MRDYLTLGSAPTDEQCAQVGTDNYREQSIKECKAFIHQLERVFGEPPAYTSYGVKSFDHDFGTYREVVVYYEEDDDVGFKFALNIENNTPQYWDEEAKAELGGYAYNRIGEYPYKFKGEKDG